MSEPEERPAGTGGCLCGAVRYRVDGPLREIIACHCGQCRRMSGHYFAATAAHRDGFEITNHDGLAWHESSSASRRGFCKRCGSSLFGGSWPEGPEVSIRLGTLDDDPGIRPQERSHVASKAPWDEITDDLPQHPRGRTEL